MPLKDSRNDSNATAPISGVGNLPDPTGPTQGVGLVAWVAVHTTRALDGSPDSL